ncbi:SusC/RagA family TonB-linked outer membrane protein [Flavihumibacter solisilvae]|uniref:Membrane protein n=1 Tax=Flavihumibacter solisilvae TaxID=1349421 RepID=A0A0C1IG09_9BACT|nr:SusC/RagA family TonB-linked outer membrane protein [Flavihumibacter solisilvae]KIC93080.1 membrane protein [Flavihumibacter solisilvae]
MKNGSLHLFFLRRLWLPVLCCCLGFAASAQVRISGKVTTAKGQPATGITVVVKNTTSGTSTGADGNYEISAPLKPGSYQLEFSGIGFKTQLSQVTVGDATTYDVNVQLVEDAMGLDEVIVTGTSAGTTKKQLGSYISTVKAEDLNKGASSNVLASLQGKTAGAQITQNSGDPAGGMSVRLRGISSINSSSEPLYIVDGIIINNSTNRVTNTQGNYDGQNFVGSIGTNRLADINPADIERVEVLNGAAAAAIYGSRANAGVVQIFTKRGSTGAPVVSFSTSVMVSELRNKVPVSNAPTKFGGTPDEFTQDIITSVGTPPALLTNTTAVQRYDYNDYIFRTGVGTDNNVSVTGGRDKTKYYLSGSYFYNQGIIKNTDFQRYSFRSNIDQAIGEKLNVSLNLNYINSKGDEKPDGNSFYSPMNSINIIGNFHDIWTRDALGNIKAVGERGRVNPVSIIEDIKQKQETSRILAGVSLKYRPIKNLTFDYTLGIDNYAQNGTTYIPPFAYNVNPAFFGGGIGLDPAQNGYASHATYNFFQINHEVNGTYNIDITSNLQSTTQVGYSLQYEKSDYVLAQGRGLPPYVQTVTGASTQLPGNDFRGELAVQGAYLQQNFKFNNQLFVTGAVRMDGSSVFGKDQRNQVYLKASGSYVLSSAEFWENLGVSGWWDLFKIRAAYGESGNLTGIGPYDRFNGYTGVGFIGRSSFTSSATLANENMKPERQTEFEIGTDLSFMNNRIGLQFNWYTKKVKDLLINRVIAPTTGYSSRLDNFGSLENKGIELVLNAAPVRGKDWRWDITAIYNRNRNKAVEIGQALTLLSTNSGAPVAILEGQPVGVFYGTFFARDGNGAEIKNTNGIPLTERGVQNAPLDYDVQRDPTSGLPSGAVLRRIIGDPNPDWTGSLVNEVGYKKFGLRVQIDAVQGVDVFNADWRTRQGVGNGKVAEQEHKGEIPRGYIIGVYNIEEWRIDDGSFVKLREVALTYNLGKVGKTFSNVTFQLAGRNLHSWDDYKGYDPEVNAGGQSTILRGIDFGAVPIPRTYSFGIQAKF